MKEARIVIAHEQSEKALDTLGTLLTSLCAAFGGYTLTAGVGGWLDKDTVAHEDYVAILDIACDEHKDATYDKLFTLATFYGEQLGQKSVYIRYPDGTVEIADVGAHRKHRPLDADLHGKAEPDPNAVADDDGMGQATSATLDRDRVTDQVNAHAHADAVAGIRRTPRVGEVWWTRHGSRAVVTSTIGSLGFKVYKCQDLKGSYYTVNCEGRVKDGATDGGDLTAFHSYL